jgi:hypothetical protein
MKDPWFMRLSPNNISEPTQRRYIHGEFDHIRL